MTNDNDIFKTNFSETYYFYDQQENISFCLNKIGISFCYLSVVFSMDDSSSLYWQRQKCKYVICQKNKQKTNLTKVSKFSIFDLIRTV